MAKDGEPVPSSRICTVIDVHGGEWGREKGRDPLSSTGSPYKGGLPLFFFLNDNYGWGVWGNPFKEFHWSCPRASTNFFAALGTPHNGDDAITVKK